ncbi:MAG: hypothetical protein A7316_02665 [Candidatus Altiarchaeales archaeon WOR_SM1_86-2]|nr:MAG: hypothetical protein A7316_02665 [Candidatus Altiarchaeales archaeon WOR_SM1_86-2]
MANIENPSHEKEYRGLNRDLNMAVERVKDPVALATMLYTIANDRKSTNLLVGNVNAGIDNLNSKFDELTGMVKILIKQNEELLKQLRRNPDGERKEEFLSDRDMEILNFARKEGRVCADDVKEKFGYKQKNGACMRLNNLCKERLLRKEYIGRKVYYMPWKSISPLPSQPL